MTIKLLQIIFSVAGFIVAGGYFFALISSLMPDSSPAAQYFMTGWWLAAFPGFSLYGLYHYQARHEANEQISK